MIRRIRLAACFAALLAPAPLFAAQLVMIEQKYCSWCDRWNEEIGGIYAQTDEGRRAPLRRIDIADPPPADLRLGARANFTPTFVLVEKGREIGRIEGYPGDHFFWPMLGKLLERLPADSKPGS